MPQLDAVQTTNVPWAMQMKAVSIEEPGHLVQNLTGAILGCGGWVLSRSANDCGTIRMLFEFERQACVEIYSIMIAVGLELSQHGHIRFTELCQCTRSHLEECGSEIASIELEIQTFPIEMTFTRLTAPKQRNVVGLRCLSALLRSLRVPNSYQRRRIRLGIALWLPAIYNGI